MLKKRWLTSNVLVSIDGAPGLASEQKANAELLQSRHKPLCCRFISYMQSKAGSAVAQLQSMQGRVRGLFSSGCIVPRHARPCSVAKVASLNAACSRWAAGLQMAPST